MKEKMSKICLSLLFLLLFTSYAFAESTGQKIRVPAKNLLIAARTIVPQSGPYYSVEGIIKCSIISHEFPPYGSDSYCEIIINDITAEVMKPQEILKKLMQIRPMTGPTYFFSGKVILVSITQEVPPYRRSETAEVILP